LQPAAALARGGVVSLVARMHCANDRREGPGRQKIRDLRVQMLDPCFSIRNGIDVVPKVDQCAGCVKRNFAPGDNPYARKRHDFEVRRHLHIVDDRLGQGRCMLGDTCIIVDMAVWG
jgi:hypothetical protein